MSDIEDRVARYMNLVSVAGYVRLSPELIREIEARAIGPLHGPLEPFGLRLRRELAGRPFGAYRRAT